MSKGARGGGPSALRWRSSAQSSRPGEATSLRWPTTTRVDGVSGERWLGRGAGRGRLTGGNRGEETLRPDSPREDSLPPLLPDSCPSAHWGGFGGPPTLLSPSPPPPPAPPSPRACLLPAASVFRSEASLPTGQTRKSDPRVCRPGPRPPVEPEAVTSAGKASLSHRPGCTPPSRSSVASGESQNLSVPFGFLSAKRGANPHTIAPPPLRPPPRRGQVSDR